MQRLTVELTDQDIRDALGGRLEDDPVRLHFNKVIERANLQVLRVNRWNNDAILWANKDTKADLAAIPPYPYCGKERKFEFQIMPQLIYLLGTDPEAAKTKYPEIDFGSLVVFTCCESCAHILDEERRLLHSVDAETPYKEEYGYFHSHYSKKDIEDVKNQLASLTSS